MIKTIKKLFSNLSNLQTYNHFKLDFQEVDHSWQCYYIYILTKVDVANDNCQERFPDHLNTLLLSSDGWSDDNPETKCQKWQQIFQYGRFA